MLHLGSVDTPFGRMGIACDETSVLALALPGRHEERLAAALGLQRLPAAMDGPNALVERIAAELQAYFAGKLREFTTPQTRRGTAFQRQVWDAVCDVPYGETRSYGAVAAAIGRPLAARAVGHANGSNPLPIVVPCHRLVGHDGGLVRYGRHGGGLDGLAGLAMKRWLIEHEQRHAAGA